jgi:hypothetical protein
VLAGVLFRDDSLPVDRLRVYHLSVRDITLDDCTKSQAQKDKVAKRFN